MKYYESHYDEYYQSVEAFNLHSELVVQYDKFPKRIEDFGNMIIYGPSGVGKYSQMLYMLKNYSPTLLKYEKKITATIDKQTYIYKMSDIHYEIDMSLLGCNSKLLWHEIFQQIVDIVSIKPDKHGIIVCKNFHAIHNELLEIFYSYLQQYSGTSNHTLDPIKIKFIFITEHISFIPDNIVNNCYILSVKRPVKEELAMSIGIKKTERMSPCQLLSVLKSINSENIVNAKEIYSFSMVNSTSELPVDNFNIICDNIIQEMMLYKSHCSNDNDVIIDIDIGKFRDHIYDILIYNQDACDCVWYVFTYFVDEGIFDEKKIDTFMEKMYLFLKQYGNNYRAIFHIESVLFAMICAFRT